MREKTGHDGTRATGTATVYAGVLTMPTVHPLLPLFLALGAVFGALAAAAAYVISYAEYRRRRRRPDQDPRKMALHVALVAFAIFFAAATIVSFVLPAVLGRTPR